MALATKLELRQSQSLVMTPQLQQAIKLLQLSNLELADFVETELEKNPLLEYSETDNSGTANNEDGGSEKKAEGEEDLKASDDWLQESNETIKSNPSEELDTDFENVYPEDTGPNLRAAERQEWSSLNGKSNGPVGGANNLEAYLADGLTLQLHLKAQIPLIIKNPTQRLIADYMVDMVDESGYLRGNLEGLAVRLGVDLSYVEEVLQLIQGVEPTGVFSRDLRECLTLQLKEKNRYDPAIASFIEHLDLLAAHDFPALKHACGVDQEDLIDMIEEIKSLDPKPGLKFGAIAVQPVIPDVHVHRRSDGSWFVELNSETLPKVLINQSYYATVSKNAKSNKDKDYLTDCMQTANWLVKSLDQRAHTILKVAQEIVRQQDAFFALGIQYLRPLNLKAIADAISMHESTVSRVTSNKYMATPRGIFELKYFFTSAIASSSPSGETHSSESVRHRIKQLIDGESVEKILSDDKIVSCLGKEGIDIARRTVAKYREVMRIPSSVQRRREKKSILM